MGSTTPTNGDSVNTARFVALLVLLLSGTLFFMALPRVRSTLNHIAVDSVIDNINNKKNINPAQLAKLLSIAQTDIAINDNARYWQDNSTLLFYQAQRQTGRDIVLQVKNSIEQSLARSPANAYLWYKLAIVSIQLQLPAEKIAKTLLMSIMTGPNELGYLLPRLNLCLLFFNQFSKDDADILRGQLLTAWKMSPSLFMTTFANDKKSMATISALLKDNSAAVLKEIMASHEKINP